MLFCECGSNIYISISIRLTKAQEMLEVFSQLDDSITQSIDICDDPKIRKAQELIRILKEGKFRVEHNQNQDLVTVSSLFFKYFILTDFKHYFWCICLLGNYSRSRKSGTLEKASHSNGSTVYADQIATLQ